MPDVLLAALSGAVIAFLGTSLLQRAQFRRADLEGVRERLGLTRALRADLHVAKLACETALTREVITPGTRFPVDLWVSHGHRLIAALYRLAEAALIDAFGRMAMVNGLLAAPVLATQPIRFSAHNGDPEESEFAEKLQLLIDKIDTAVQILDRYEGECEQRAKRLRYPIKDRLPWRFADGELQVVPMPE
jgi:hypothetical protein